MIERSMLLDDAPAPEHLDEEVERRPRCCSLRDGKLVLDLPAEPTSVVAHHRDREAPFAVDEADDPLLGTWPFLLIDRTGRIVTAHRHRIPEGCDSERVPPDARCFQHLASCTVRNYFRQGQPSAAHRGVNLRTVIVTAAVYRGFSSELRPCGLTLPINLPAPGRRHSVYIALRLRTLLCF